MRRLLIMSQKGVTMSNKQSSKGNARDAGTGRYVTDAYARKHPKTTVTEKRK